MSSSGLRKFCICFYHQTSFLGTWNFNSENNCAQGRLISSIYTIWFMISEKKKQKKTRSRFLHRGACIHHKSLNEAYKFFFSALKLLLCGLVVLTDMSAYLQKEAGVSKHSWKKIIQLLWTVLSYLLENVKYEIKHNINSTCGDIRHLWNLQQIW